MFKWVSLCLTTWAVISQGALGQDCQCSVDRNGFARCSGTPTNNELCTTFGTCSTQCICQSHNKWCTSNGGCIGKQFDCPSDCSQGSWCSSSKSCNPTWECCPHGEKWCADENRCVPDIWSCCSMGHRWCEEESKCRLNGQPCCSEGQAWCMNENRCLPTTQECCSVGQKWCSERNNCIPNSQPCCAENHLWCEQRRACLPYSKHCCPMEYEWCAKKNLCLPNSQHCCSEGYSWCMKTKSCLHNSHPCCILRYEWCSKRSTCIPDHEKCCDSTQKWCEEKQVCLSKKEDCCKASEIWCDKSKTCISSTDNCKCLPGYYLCNKTKNCIPNNDVCEACNSGEIMCIYPPNIHPTYSCQTIDTFSGNSNIRVCPDGICQHTLYSNWNCQVGQNDCEEGAFRCGEDCQPYKDFIHYRTCQGRCIQRKESCSLIKEEKSFQMELPMIIGLGAGGGVILCLIIVSVIFTICIKKRNEILYIDQNPIYGETGEEEYEMN